MADGPGRDRKKGLDYYPWVISAYDNDPKLFDLLDKYGPLGDTVYRRCLDMIYTNGYYIEIDINTLARKIISKIGNRWTKGVHQIVCILHFCSDIGLFESSLAEQGIWTSFGIQKNYLFVAGRRKIYDTKYLINRDIPLIAPKIVNSVTENDISATENIDNVAKLTPKKTKVYKTKENKDLCTIFKQDDAFEKFWNEYPRKINKKSASLKFKKVCQDEVTYKALMEGLENQRRLKQWGDIQYIPHPTTWLNGERWNDEISDTKSGTYYDKSDKQLPEWYTNQDAIKVDTSEFDASELEANLKALRGEI